MAPKSCGIRVIFGISNLHVFAQLLVRVHLVLVGKDLLVPRAQVAHLLVVDGADMAVEIGPAETSKVAAGFGAVIPKQQHRVADNVFAGIPDADVLVRRSDITSLIVFEFFRGIVGEDDIGGVGLEHVSILAPFSGMVGCGTHSAVRTLLILVEPS